MKLGTEDRKKVYALAGLGVVAAYLLYTNVLSGPGSGSAPPPSRPAPAVATAPPPVAPAGSGSTPPAPRRAVSGTLRKGDDFRPVLRSKRPEDRIDPASIDPTLRLDLFAKVQKVEFAGGGRNVFQFGPAPAPKAADLGKEPKVPLGPIQGPKTPEQAKAAEPKPPVKPPPPPINLKYYGFSSSRASSRKTAFFLDGEEILVAAEGETVKKRYKVVRINVNSVLMEDIVAKSEQTLPMQEDLAGAG